MEQIIYNGHYSWEEVQSLRKAKKLRGLIQEYCFVNSGKMDISERCLEGSTKITITYWEI